MANVYDILTISRTFISSGAYYDPATSVKLLVKAPNAALVTYSYGAAEITKDSTGHYHKNITVDAPGDWTFVWTSDDATKGHTEYESVVNVNPAPSQTIKEIR